MKQEIANTANYHIYLDEEKRRIYLKLIGFWSVEEEAREYLALARGAVDQLNGPFTAVVDVSDFKIPKPEIGPLIKESQGYFMSHGMRKSAELISESVFTDMAVEKIKKENNLSEEVRKKFSSLEEAEAWLDL